ncbi:hypothetical protein [Streptococcus oralis]|uniref:Uncharacterized protein n=1 Tax=Streptococcus oralis subsp. oralis TaxID=1891914 RepID=A0A1X1GP02_STROR|nr:hypothetical protein [Streptococcus oralis]MBA1351035.1 hypothetical protein [Streptococcus oralis subsp. oralis]ORO48597.1 hypothetical protein B7723_03980 [Streptococcus oralis subsp. oralis]ORO71097.1 hypothetical protein B7712_07795 [Streptococcus oralis subsp. oralis]
MTLKNLRNFLTFDKSFFDNKELVYLGSKLTQDNKLKVSLLIFKDTTEYQNGQTNLGEQVVVTVNNKGIDDYSSFKPLQTVCKVVNISKATVYGEYQNQLSITADVILDSQGNKQHEKG